MVCTSTGKPVHLLGLCDIRLRQNAIIIFDQEWNGMVQYLNEIENSEPKILFVFKCWKPFQVSTQSGTNFGPLEGAVANE
jgi:hypothetical protein